VSDETSVSVIVTTRNSAATLAACLESIRAQSAPVELIVVDNFSTDATPSIAQHYASTFSQAGPERSRQRNLGAAMATGYWFFFVDSDMVLAPTTIAESLDQVRAGVRAVIVPEVSEGQGFWAACKALERACYVGDDTIEAARFIEKTLFQELGGFDEELTGEEDWDLTARIRQRGLAIGRTGTPLVHDEGRLTLRETMRTKFYYGRTMARYLRKHAGTARAQMRLFRPAFFRNRRLLRAHPVRATGMIAMKTCEVGAGALGTVVGMWAERRR
jgi:glycosyltransferase involved in cell wall biosynthesis